MSKEKIILLLHSGSKQFIIASLYSCDLTIWQGQTPMSKQELLQAIPGHAGIFCALTERIDKEVLDAAGGELKVVSTISVGHEHIDVAECKRRGIRVGYTPDVLTSATAELTLALLLSTGRRLLEANKEVYNGGWRSWAPSWMCGPGVKGSVMGIVGFGRIGQAVASRLIPFLPKEIIFSNRSRKEEAAKQLKARQVEFEELLQQSDYVILCCALSPETANLIDEKALKMMKSSAILINTARGGCVDQEALYSALKSGEILAAGLDVTTPEPLPLDSPLLSLNNIVILPHIGSADIDTRIEMSRITGCNVLAGINGGEMISEL